VVTQSGTLSVPNRRALVFIRKRLWQIVIPAASFLALDGKHVDRQTFQVLKTWKV